MLLLKEKFRGVCIFQTILFSVLCSIGLVALMIEYSFGGLENFYELYKGYGLDIDISSLGDLKAIDVVFQVMGFSFIILYGLPIIFVWKAYSKMLQKGIGIGYVIFMYIHGSIAAFSLFSGLTNIPNIFISLVLLISPILGIVF